MTEPLAQVTEERIPFKHTKTGYLVGDVEFNRYEGFWHIRKLVMNPGVEISANELRCGGIESGEIFEELTCAHMFPRQPIYNQRELNLLNSSLEKMRECVSCPEDFEEIESLEIHLEQAAYKDKRTGKYTRSKSFTDEKEGSRQTVKQNINAVVNLLAENPTTTDIAMDLKDNIKTGHFCSYSGKKEWSF